MPKTPQKKPNTKQSPHQVEASSVRQLKHTPYKSFRASKKKRRSAEPVPKARILFWESLLHLKTYWKLYGFIALVYLLLTVVLVKGFTTALDLSTIKQNLQASFGAQSQAATSFTLFGYLLGNGNAGVGDAASAYQSLLLIIVSLALIWALRQTWSGKRPRFRDTFYVSMGPLIPFVLVLLVIGLQLLPLALGNAVYGMVAGSGVAVTVVEKIVWLMLFFCLVLLSLYMLTSSLFALYIVTLPDVTPMQALRSARELVRYRRWVVLRKILFLPLVMFVVLLVVMYPVLAFATPLAEWVFVLLSLAGIVVIHAYMYRLYRSLL